MAKCGSVTWEKRTICVIESDAPDEQIITHPPLVCIEILSPKDALNSLRERVIDYEKFGVPNIWIIDSSTQCGYDCKPGAMIDAVEFAVSASPIKLVMADIYADLD
jgi:hypothetical protein